MIPKVARLAMQLGVGWDHKTCMRIMQTKGGGRKRWEELPKRGRRPKQENVKRSLNLLTH